MNLCAQIQSTQQREVPLTASIQLIVGLANPGSEYANTRHNAGAWFVELLAQSANLSLRHETKLHGKHGLYRDGSKHCHLLIPSTYMNLSGIALHSCANYHKLPSTAILVAHDDIDLPVGTIKLKFDGGDGGHNGLKDIIKHLHTKQFYRLRIGVGRPTHSHDVVNYVLKAPSKTERALIDDQLLYVANDILPIILNGELEKAMQTLHTETK